MGVASTKFTSDEMTTNAMSDKVRASERKPEAVAALCDGGDARRRGVIIGGSAGGDESGEERLCSWADSARDGDEEEARVIFSFNSRLLP